MIWSLVRYAQYGYTQYWLIFLTQWVDLTLMLYFFAAALLHFRISQHIEDNALSLVNYFHVDTTSNPSFVGQMFVSEIAI